MASLWAGDVRAKRTPGSTSSRRARLGAEAIELFSGHDLVHGKADLHGNGLGGQPVVPGHHDDADTRPPTQVIASSTAGRGGSQMAMMPSRVSFRSTFPVDPPAR